MPNSGRARGLIFLKRCARGGLKKILCTNTLVGTCRYMCRTICIRVSYLSYILRYTARRRTQCILLKNTPAACPSYVLYFTDCIVPTCPHTIGFGGYWKNIFPSNNTVQRFPGLSMIHRTVVVCTGRMTYSTIDYEYASTEQRRVPQLKKKNYIMPQ